MTRKAALARLRFATDLAFERQLARLQAAQAACAATGELLAGLAVRADPAEDPVTAARQQIAYEIWAAGRRRELNLLLAQQTATREEARRLAGIALARRTVTAKLARPGPR